MFEFISDFFKTSNPQKKEVMISSEPLKNKFSSTDSYIETLTNTLEQYFKEEFIIEPQLYNKDNYDSNIKLPFKFEDHSLSKARAISISENDGSIYDIDSLGSRHIGVILNPEENIKKIPEALNELSLEKHSRDKDIFFFITKDFEGNIFNSPEEISEALVNFEQDPIEQKLKISQFTYEINGESLRALECLPDNFNLPISLEEFSKISDNTVIAIEILSNETPTKSYTPYIMYGAAIVIISGATFLTFSQSRKYLAGATNIAAQATIQNGTPEPTNNAKHIDTPPTESVTPSNDIEAGSQNKAKETHRPKTRSQTRAEKAKIINTGRPEEIPVKSTLSEEFKKITKKSVINTEKSGNIAKKVLNKLLPGEDHSKFIEKLNNDEARLIKQYSTSGNKQYTCEKFLESPNSNLAKIVGEENIPIMNAALENKLGEYKPEGNENKDLISALTKAQKNSGSSPFSKEAVLIITLATLAKAKGAEFPSGYIILGENGEINLIPESKSVNKNLCVNVTYKNHDKETICGKDAEIFVNLKLASESKLEQESPAAAEKSTTASLAEFGLCNLAIPTTNLGISNPAVHLASAAVASTMCHSAFNNNFDNIYRDLTCSTASTLAFYATSATPGLNFLASIATNQICTLGWDYLAAGKTPSESQIYSHLAQLPTGSATAIGCATIATAVSTSAQSYVNDQHTSNIIGLAFNNQCTNIVSNYISGPAIEYFAGESSEIAA